MPDESLTESASDAVPLEVSLQYYDRDVRETFSGFQGPDREDVQTLAVAELKVASTERDGIVALRINGLELTMSTSEARMLGRELIAEADAQDAALGIEDEDEDSPLP
jgi:hypothetical protein